jgi:hypothetical protein
MPFKDWIIQLEDARIEVWRVTDDGAVVAFAVVLVALVGGEWTCVTRYDTAHGFPHQDVLGRKVGLLYKREFPGLSMKTVFGYAIYDCQQNHKKHIEFYRSH